MSSRVVNKLLDSPTPLLNLIFIGIMIGGSILILGALYLIYDVQILGERLITKTDLMMVSITFTMIHIILTNTLLFVFKKMRHNKTITQKERITKIHSTSFFVIFHSILDSSPSLMNLIFVGIMIGGSILILGSLYLIYDVQVFGERTNTKADLMTISIAFTIIHIILTNALLVAFKKFRYAKTIIQNEKEELTKIDKAKDEFAAMIAHELKNPLVPISSYSKMLLDGRFGELTSIQKEKMKIVISGTESMLILIQDMLDIHKAELGKITLNLQSFCLSEIIDTAVTITQPLAEKRGVEICNSVTRDILVNVDVHRIEQVLINLIKNAIDFVPKDTGTIKISVELQDNTVIISVKDNGCGIPKEELGNLFRKFYQTNASKNRERNSSGLGLSICSSIIDLHHGKMWAESDIGCGTTIKFQLPLIPTQQVESKTLIEETI